MQYLHRLTKLRLVLPLLGLLAFAAPSAQAEDGMHHHHHRHHHHRHHHHHRA